MLSSVNNNVDRRIMNLYARSIGFRDWSASEEERFIVSAMENVDEAETAEVNKEVNRLTLLISTSYSYTTGIYLHCDIRDKSLNYNMHYPYVCSGKGKVRKTFFVRRRNMDEGFIAYVSSEKLSNAICFHLINMNDLILYLTDRKMITEEDLLKEGIGKINSLVLEDINVRLSGLARYGVIILASGDNAKMPNYVRQGVTPTREDLWVRAYKEDAMSLINTTFMPDGTEQDSYYIIGNIISVKEERNIFTNEKFFLLELETCGENVTVAINKQDLVGVPKAGRRFKGTVWLQGFAEILDY